MIEIIIERFLTIDWIELLKMFVFFVLGSFYYAMISKFLKKHKKKQTEVKM